MELFRLYFLQFSFTQEWPASKKKFPGLIEYSSYLRGVKINILLGLFMRKLESSKCDIWKELHDYHLKWEQSSSCMISYFFPADFERDFKILIPIKAQES